MHMSRRTITGLAGIILLAAVLFWAAQSVDLLAMLRRMHGM